MNEDGHIVEWSSDIRVGDVYESRDGDVYVVCDVGVHPRDGQLRVSVRMLNDEMNGTGHVFENWFMLEDDVLVTRG